MNGRSKEPAAKTPASNPFHFIDRTLNLLIVEDDPIGSDMLLELLEPATCYSVYAASTNGRALELLRSGKRFHVCIMDLGIRDVENDEFYLLRNYAHHSSIIVLSGSPSPQKGAACVHFGARAVSDKGASFDIRNFFRTINRLALINVVNHRFNERSGDTLNVATATLFETCPDSVTQWAENLRITDRQLRNLWHTGSGFGAKHVLFLHQCLKSAFAYYDTLIFGTGQERLSAGRLVKRKYGAYFRQQYEVLNFMLS